MTSSPPVTSSVPDLLGIYRTARRIDLCNQRIESMLGAGQLAFQYYPCGGQEIIAATVCQVLRPDDLMVTTYRGIHDIVAKGTPIREVIAEVAGRVTGTSKGKGGPMHLSDPQSGLMVTTGIVGAGLPIANGLALAAQMKGTGQVCVVSFGDGATSIGAFHEAMNLASLWRLPVIFLCQNNEYAEYTAYAEYTRAETLAQYGRAYDMPGHRLDGTDPSAMFPAALEAVSRARSGGGPTLLECVAHRLQGHSFGADQSHMDQEKLRIARARRPVERLRAQLIATKCASEDDIALIDSDAKSEVDDAVTFALASARPSESELYVDVFADSSINPDLSETAPPRPATVARKVESRMTMCAAINDALATAMAIDESVFTLGEDIADPAGGVLKATVGLSQRFGTTRVRATPIAEQAIVGAAIGAALGGLRPVAEIMICDFLMVCMDQVANHAAKLRYMSGGRTGVPMTIRTAMAGNIGAFGAQHSQSLEAWLAHTPGLKVVAPSTPADAKGLLLSSIFDDDPVVVIEPVRAYFDEGMVPEGDYRVPIGVADIKRPGTDVTIISYGWTVRESLVAAEELAKLDISAEVLDLRSIIPLDRAAILKSVSRTRRALIVHGAVKFCGVGAEIAALIYEELHGSLLAPVGRVGAAFTPVPFTPALESLHFPDTARVVSAARKSVGR